MDRKKVIELFVVSFIALFFEMFFIRYIPSIVKVVGYFTNIVLIACFLGLGAGCLLARLNIRLVKLFPLSLMLLIIITTLSINISSTSPQVDGLYLPARGNTLTVAIYLILSLFFLFTALTFIPLGQEIGRLFTEFSPLVAYTINIAGSIAGILAFSVFSLLSLSPPLWFAISLPFLIFTCREKRVWTSITVMALLISLCIIYATCKDSLWSPYHKITISRIYYYINRATGEEVLIPDDAVVPSQVALPSELGFKININRLFYQSPSNLTDSVVEKYDFLKQARLQYDVPYKYGQRDHILILGGGSGNDTAAAIRNGGKKIDVVDIDPLILKLGKEKHPEKPYDNPHVTLYSDDARSFLHKTREKYDLIVFSFLDSHIIQSSMSNVRLDSFVYTLESFQEARKHLNEGGIIALGFATNADWMGERLLLMLTEAFNKCPYNVREGSCGFNFIAGDSIEKIIPRIPRYVISEDTLINTDDWPFFYMKTNTIPKEYAITLGLIFIISLLTVLLSNRSSQRGLEFHFFFLGSAFMLLETKSITSLALLFGSTWIVNSIVILFIMIMILLANFYIYKAKTVNIRYIYCFLGITLMLNSFVPLKSLQLDSLFLKLFVSGILISSPLFFAGIIFAHSFSQTEKPDLALGSNILGGVLGGILEYKSLVTGFYLLFLVIAILYALSYICIRKKSPESR